MLLKKMKWGSNTASLNLKLWKRLEFRTRVSYAESLEVINLFQQREDIFPISKCARQVKHLLEIYKVEMEEYVLETPNKEESEEDEDIQLLRIETGNKQRQRQKRCKKGFSTSMAYTQQLTRNYQVFVL
jgi:uncharacterized protein YrzB (UPF0473 family)